MRVGRTLTHHFEIETRQYDLLGIDLGEGARRRMIIFGAVIILVWIALLVPFIGVPQKPTVSLYVVPPFVITAFGWRAGKHHERRRRVTEWALAVRYALRSHRPIIGLGARAADKTEYLPWRERVATQKMANLARARVTPEWDREDVVELDPQVRAGADITVNQRARLLGADHVQKVSRRTSSGLSRLDNKGHE
ncbi:hypothetical protein [Kribbella sp. CA-294648]|uniref:hypothetical protein n=1 Tax=Kribbella sp. CA-294648 TaxID=3239948 RepID=UPI003D8E56CC